MTKNNDIMYFDSIYSIDLIILTRGDLSSSTISDLREVKSTILGALTSKLEGYL